MKKIYNAYYSANNGADYTDNPFSGTNLKKLTDEVKKIVREKHLQQANNSSYIFITDGEGREVARYEIEGLSGTFTSIALDID